uniref:Uncharacterized protein n=1 Tax=Anguilla anguilla TaxID=7936 RepID=A0A0E9UBF4_ANGAN
MGCLCFFLHFCATSKAIYASTILISVY